ncbi:hypothetical protein [Sinosporangium siamense]|uniref:Uncharacterized protein n=1 Tax=Sinosporangium siamense TaxID=1367973 RepID=A0A919VF79_9ACTN|nr:hypothetical protein [Sinosporangium siamense]GII95869.1 hypothetical protein Ssi02_61000 [Sinosporangium siamense]
MTDVTSASPPAQQSSLSAGSQSESYSHSLTHRVVAKLIKWLIVSLLVGLSPIIINAFILYSSGKQISQVALFGTGELYLVSTGIIAAGIGELYFELKNAGPRTGNPYMQLSTSTAVSLSVLLAICCAGAYGGKPAYPNPLDHYVSLSIYMFLGAVITSASCTILSEFR